MISTLLVVQILLTIAIIIVIMLQKSSSIGLGAYSGSNESMFGAKGPASFLAKATFVLAILFVLNTLAMGYLYNQEKSQSVTDTLNSATSVPTTQSTSSVPTADNNKSGN
jgi:preprotein translocase subunit SecG